MQDPMKENLSHRRKLPTFLPPTQYWTAGTYPEHTPHHMEIHTYTWFTAAWFVTAKYRKVPNCQSTRDWLNKLGNIHPVDPHPRNCEMSEEDLFELIWSDFQAPLSDKSKMQKRAYSMLHFLKLIYFYLFMAVLGFRFCVRAFSSCGERGPLFIAVRGPLTMAASLVAEHRLQTRRLSNCGSRA